MSSNILKRLKNYAELMRLDKPIGTFLLLWPTLWSIWLASEGQPQAKIIIIFLLGVLTMRSAGCVINDFADRKFDPFVERTKNRPLARGDVSIFEALMLFTGLSLIGIFLALQLNYKTQLFAVAGGCITIIYPFIKRFFSIPQLILGIAFGWACPMAFTAQVGNVTKLGWIVFTTAIIWAVIYDTFYAMSDRKDDLKIGIKSTAILFGQHDLLIIFGSQLLMIISLIYIGKIAELGYLFYVSIGISTIFMIYQQWLARDRVSQNCFAAFMNNNYVGMTIFIGISADYMLTL
jgi:4-hydroxybenzoate polyprenyltransferase